MWSGFAYGYLINGKSINPFPFSLFFALGGNICSYKSFGCLKPPFIYRSHYFRTSTSQCLSSIRWKVFPAYVSWKNVIRLFWRNYSNHLQYADSSRRNCIIMNLLGKVRLLIISLNVSFALDDWQKTANLTGKLRAKNALASASRALHAI